MNNYKQKFKFNDMSNITADFQLSSLIAAKKYLRRKKKSGVDISLSPFCDFVTWAECLGKENLKTITKNKQFSLNLFFSFLKEIFFIRNSYAVYKNFQSINKNFLFNVVCSYCERTDFNKQKYQL